MSDSSIIGTADDAVATKYAAVQAGYYDDPFLAPFTTQQRRRDCQPIIKRGTHARVMCINRAIGAFLETRDENAHVVVLGAGKDTTFFRYMSGLVTEHPKPVQWYEIDHPSVIHHKVRIIQQQQQIFQVNVETHGSGGFIMTSKIRPKPTSKCHLIGHDLRDSASELIQKLSQHGLNGRKHAVLFVAECVQLYLGEGSSRTLWTSLAQECPSACLVLFDPIVGNDSSFGSVMEQNLLRANVITTSSSMVHTRTLVQQVEKLVDLCSWHQAIGCDMWWAYSTILTPEQRQRAQACEFLDELEEWKLIMQHYCIVVACTTESGLDFCQTGPLLGLDASKSQLRTTKKK